MMNIYYHYQDIYIQNPVKAGISSGIDSYKWSSFSEYLGHFDQRKITETYYLLSIIDKESFIKYNCEEEKEEYEINSNVGKRDNLYIKNRIREIINDEDPFKLGQFSKEERNRIISYLKNKEEFSIRQIERATGISRGVISRCKLD